MTGGTGRNDNGRVLRKSASRLGWRRSATADVKSSTVKGAPAEARLVVSNKGDESFPPRNSMWSVSSKRSASVRTDCGADSVRRIQEPVAPTWRNPLARKAVEGEVNAVNAGPLGTSRRDWVTVSQGRDPCCETTR